VEYTIIAQSALADHSITIFNLTGINIVDLLAAVRLTDPLRRAIVLHGLLFAGTVAVGSLPGISPYGAFDMAGKRCLGGVGSKTLLPSAISVARDPADMPVRAHAIRHQPES